MNWWARLHFAASGIVIGVWFWKVAPLLMPPLWLVVVATTVFLWLMSFQWHLVEPDWMPQSIIDDSISLWGWVNHRLGRGKGETHGTPEACDEAGDA